MTETASKALSRPLNTIALASFVVALASAAAAGAGIGAASFVALGALLLAGTSALMAYRRLIRAEKEARRAAAAFSAEVARRDRALSSLMPALELLAEEDTAIAAAAGASRAPLSFSPSDASPLERAERFAAQFTRPDGSSFDRIRALAEECRSFEALREMELRIPFIDEILKRVVAHTEQAAMTLIERFSQISEQTDASDRDAKNALHALGNKDGSGLESLISQSHESIIGRNSVINDFLKLNRENADRVKKMSDLVDRSEVLISGIEDITERSKLIAFNMAVESAKIGDKGRGFKVIVNELQRLNDQTTGFARDIMEIVKSFRSYNEELLDQWLTKSETLTDKLRSDSDQAEVAVTALKQSFDLTGTLFHSLSESAISVNRSMSDILESLQFQDITRQQIEGAVSFLMEIRSSVEDLRNRFSSIGSSFGNAGTILKAIKEKHERQLKVSKDHDLFELIERRYR